MTEQGATIVLSPLADPVVGATFCDVEHAGEAAASIIGAILAKDGVSIGKILSVTPQRYYKFPDGRGVRIDVEAVAEGDRHVIIEFQAERDPSLFQRNLFSASRIFTATTPVGSRPRVLSSVTHKVIAINLLDFNLRDSNTDYLQPVKILYAKPPHDVALDTFAIYNIQLPRFREAAADFNDNLYCWLYALDTAGREKKTLTEVIEMTPELRAFTERDTGFQQYCKQYNRVASSPQTREEYLNWLDENTRQWAMAEWKRTEGRAQGIAEGIAQGVAQGKLEAAKSFLAMGLTPEQVAQGTGLPLADVKALQG
ncbi:MAG: PD-(D/E)XK nuclease family transposase [Spirochaetaceae bacterium]|jgi:predicted transposase/invertase (TIGR01784 family)|nr:PD-(D/E)XK nuclease family transposase [Spirochaetaceae bacterium]